MKNINNGEKERERVGGGRETTPLFPLHPRLCLFPFLPPFYFSGSPSLVSRSLSPRPSFPLSQHRSLSLPSPHPLSPPLLLSSSHYFFPSTSSRSLSRLLSSPFYISLLLLPPPPLSISTVSRSPSFSRFCDGGKRQDFNVFKWFDILKKDSQVKYTACMLILPNIQCFKCKNQNRNYF